MGTHMHKFKIESEVNSGHQHKVLGCAESMFGFANLHFHFFSGVSSYNNHTHYYTGMTGLPIKTENGHIHKVESLLELNALHEHKFSGFTFEEISYIPSRQTKGAFV